MAETRRTATIACWVIVAAGSLGCASRSPPPTGEPRRYVLRYLEMEAESVRPDGIHPILAMLWAGLLEQLADADDRRVLAVRLARTSELDSGQLAHRIRAHARNVIRPLGEQARRRASGTEAPTPIAPEATDESAAEGESPPDDELYAEGEGGAEGAEGEGAEGEIFPAVARPLSPEGNVKYYLDACKQAIEAGADREDVVSRSIELLEQLAKLARESAPAR